MATTRMFGDVLVLGHSFEAALSATLLARRGWKVIWVTPPAPAAPTVAGHRLSPAPGLVPSLENAPGLNRALQEAGLLADVQRLWRPVDLQLLAPRRRLVLPRHEERWAGVKHAAEDLRQLAGTPWNLGFFGRRRLGRTRAALHVAPTDPLAVEATEALDSILGDGDEALRVAADPHEITGGRAALSSLLAKRFAELAGITIAQGLDAPVSAISVGWGGAKVTLAKGDELAARLLLVGLDDDERERLIPADLPSMARLERRLAAPARPLWRLAFVVHPRGLPAPLGPAALLHAETGFALLERRSLDPSHDELTVAWRGDDTPVPQQEARVLRALRAALPFFEPHVLGRLGPLPVPHHGRPEAPRVVRPARRLLHARTPALGLAGLEGAGLYAEALADQATRLAPRKDLLA